MKNQFFLILAGILCFSFALSSCSKDQKLNVSEAQDQDGSQFKSAVLRGVNLSPIEQLGKNIYFDKISVPNSMACADCHAPKTGFTGPMAGINIHGSVYRGADAQNFGNRKPPSAAYATFSPVLHLQKEGEEDLFVGGNFWDGRASGEHFKNNEDVEKAFPGIDPTSAFGLAAAQQAIGPFLNPAEHNLADAKAVLMIIAKAKYAPLWKTVWGEELTYENDEDVNKNYDRLGLTIAAYEASPEVNQFSSKFDYYKQGMVELTEQEKWGLEIFNRSEGPGAGKCALCHSSEGEKPLFTDFTFDNLGTPKNPANPVYKTNPDFIDKGLGGFLETLEAGSEWKELAGENMGKHKVPTLRNVDKKAGAGFTKAYLHNGVFKSLKEVVHFYNTRDVAGAGWPKPEVEANVNTEELGNLGLTDEEEDALVAFMKTLSDGYVLK